jgi:hypothetical protein
MVTKIITLMGVPRLHYRHGPKDYDNLYTAEFFPRAAASPLLRAPGSVRESETFEWGGHRAGPQLGWKGKRPKVLKRVGAVSAR